MSMYQGLDLSRFKRVSSDKKTTTLRHVNGHEMKIAHGGLTPKMREHINSLPQHEETSKVKMYAEGTPDEPVSEEDDAPVIEEDLVPIDEDSPAPVEDMPAEAPAVQPSAAPSPVAPPAPAPVQAHPAPVAQPAPVAPAQPQVPPQVQIAQDMSNDDMEFQRYLQAGKIQPKTYHDLYAKKDTLGKIGTLFGLMLSGAGSGLTKQPNAVLEMMNKEIQNDFEAQKASQTGAQNWYQMSKNYEMQKAQQRQMDVQNTSTMMGLAKIPAEIESIRANAQQTQANAALIYSNQALNRMKIAAVQNLQDQVNKMPDGPQKGAAQQQVDFLSQAVQKDVESGNLKVGDQIVARDKLTAAEQQTEETGVDLDRLNKLIAAARGNAALDVPSAVSESDIANAQKEAGEVAMNRAISRAYDKSFRELNSQFAAGKLNPELFKALTAPVAAEIVKARNGTVSTAEAQTLAEAMFPSIKDWGGSRLAKYKKTMDGFQNDEADKVTLKRLGLLKPFPNMLAGKGKKSGGGKFKEGQVAKNKKGERLIYRGGKWHIESKQAKK